MIRERPGPTNVRFGLYQEGGWVTMVFSTISRPHQCIWMKETRNSGRIGKGENVQAM